MSKKINKKLKSKGLWARLAALMVVLLMTTAQNTLMGQQRPNGTAISKDGTGNGQFGWWVVNSGNGYLSSEITLKAGRTVTVSNKTLDLNGKTLSGCSISIGKNSGSAITFTIIGGTGGELSSSVTINSGCTLIVNSGNISGNITINSGGKLTVSSSGTITGTITNNGTLTVNGGTISSVTNNGTLTMSGGTISGNVTVSGGSFAMSGGTITGVVSDNGGLYVTGGTVTLSGTAKITGNTKADGTPRNLYLASGKTVTVNTLGSEASIGVTTADEPTASESVRISTQTNTDYHEKFIPDDKSYETAYENNYIVLKKKSTPTYNVTIIDESGVVVGVCNNLNEALDSGSSTGQTVIMHTSLTENITISKTVTLNLNGNMLTGTGTGAVITIGTGGNLTLEATNGGTITGGSTGVHVSAGTFTMNGGTITGNTNYGVNFENGTVTLGGNAIITGNTNCNLYLASGKTVKIGDNGLSSGASIGVTKEIPSGSTSVKISTDQANGYKDKFFPDDDESYDVDYDDDKYIVLKKKSTPPPTYNVTIEGVAGGFDNLTKALASSSSTGKTVIMHTSLTENISISKTVTLNLNGNTLTGNGDTVITINNPGNLTLKDGIGGGTVTGGTTGVYVEGKNNGNKASFTMYGGYITGNGTGVDVENYSKVTLVGTAKISGNTGKNLYIASGTVAIATSGNKLTDGAEIGVTLKNNIGDFATGASEGDDAYFSSDVLEYYDTFGGGVLKLVSGAVTISEFGEETYGGHYNLKGKVEIKNGKNVKITGNIHNSTPDNLIIEDGGQLITNSKNISATIEKKIEMSETSSKGKVDNWYLFCSPAQKQYIHEVIQAQGDKPYDFYRLNITHTGQEWENYKNTNNTDFNVDNHGCLFEDGRGYLYANGDGTTLQFKGKLYNGNSVKRTLNEGFNIVGNPFAQEIPFSNFLSDNSTFDGFYRLVGRGWVPYNSSNEIIKPMEGILVESSSGTLTIRQNTGNGNGSKSNNEYIEISVANSQYNDRAYALFGGEGGHLTKIEHLSDEVPMLYIPQDGGDYAIASMGESTKEFAVSFEAKTTGKYVLSMNSNRSFTYLHLIDHETGAEIDMLANEEYEFIGSPADSKDRFTVRLEADSDEAIEQHFAYQVGSELVVSGEGTLQVMDVLGRVVLSEEVNGSTRVSVSGLRTGAYIVRMIGNEIKTQKVVIK